MLEKDSYPPDAGSTNAVTQEVIDLLGPGKPQAARNRLRFEEMIQRAIQIEAEREKVKDESPSQEQGAPENSEQKNMDPRFKDNGPPEPAEEEWAGAGNLKPSDIGLEEPGAKDEVLAGYYMRLAIVHDIILRGKGMDSLLEGVELPERYALELTYQSADPPDFTFPGYDRDSIDAAMRAVKADLAAGGRVGEEHDRGKAPPEKLSDDSTLSPKDLAKLFDVPQEPLRKRLERLRKKDHKCFLEAANRAPQEPQFIYYLGKVKHVIEDMQQKAASSEMSSKRPAKKNSP